MSRKIYCISGLGADEKVFCNLQLNGHKLVHIPWLVPKKKEDLQSYAARMASFIKDPSPVLLGVSFGGMVGIEIAKQMELKRLIIISSIKSTNELPRWMKIAGKIKLNKVLPVKSTKLTEALDNNRLGVATKEEKIMVRNYRKNANPVYVDWAINQVINWKNDWHPGHIVHIHGDRDKLFPIKKIAATHVINGGTHMMIYNRASEIGNYIESLLH